MHHSTGKHDVRADSEIQHCTENQVTVRAMFAVGFKMAKNHAIISRSRNETGLPVHETLFMCLICGAIGRSVQTSKGGDRWPL
jgi:hypothetical protein